MKAKIHKFEQNGTYILLDVNSGAVHVIDKMIYDLMDTFTIKVCYRTCLGAFHHDRRADDRLSCSILNDTTNIYLLCICHCANCTERRAH